MDNQAKEKSKPLPAWARALIAFVVLVGVATVTGALGLTIFLKNTFGNSQDPAFIKSVAKKVADFPEPLPKGYSYFFGADIVLAKVVVINYENGKQQFEFLCYNSKFLRPRGAGDSLIGTATGAAINSETRPETEQEKMLANVCDQDVRTVAVQGRFASMIAKGSWLMQGMQIPYRIGRLDDPNHNLCLVACIMDERTNKDIVFYAVQPEGKKFDMKGCTDLLQDIKGF